MTDKRPILIVGLPRSGTTWVGEVLASAHGARYVFEPDNEGLSPIAWLSKRGMHRFPYLAATDLATDYHRLWNTIIAGNGGAWYANVALGLYIRRLLGCKSGLESYMGEKCGLRYVDRKMHWVGQTARKTPYDVEHHPFIALLARHLLISERRGQPDRHIIVKSVHAPLSIEWITANFPVRALIVLRNPYSLYASYRRMRLPDGYRNLLFQSNLQRDWHLFGPEPSRLIMQTQEDLVASQIMCMYKIMECQFARHPDWILVSHDRFCVTPHQGYSRIFEELDLAWSKTTDRKIATLNKPGKDFDPRRVAKEQPNKWKSELSEADQTTIRHWIDIFGLNDFFREYVTLD